MGQLSLLFTKQREFLRKLVTVGAGSLFFLALKTVLVATVDHFWSLEAWLNYLIVITLTTWLGLFYHARFSFRVKIDRRMAGRFLQQSIAFKVLDYATYNLFFYAFHKHLVWSVVLTSGVIFLLRFVVFTKYVFRREFSSHLAHSEA